MVHIWIFPDCTEFWGDLIDRSDYQSADNVLNSPESVEALTFIQDLFKNNYTLVQPAGDDEFLRQKNRRTFLCRALDVDPAP